MVSTLKNRIVVQNFRDKLNRAQHFEGIKCTDRKRQITTQTAAHAGKDLVLVTDLLYDTAMLLQ